MELKELRYKIELLVDKSIPYLVILMLCLIVFEFFFTKQAEPYVIYITWVDYLIIFIFCVDLFFKYLKVRRIPDFLRKHWIDLLAVFPFFLVFRFFEQMYLLANLPALLTQPPTLLHETVILEKEGIRLLKVAENPGRLSRTRMILRFLKPLQRLPRLLKILPYYERPTVEHHNAIDEIRQERLKKKR